MYYKLKQNYWLPGRGWTSLHVHPLNTPLLILIAQVCHTNVRKHRLTTLHCIVVYSLLSQTRIPGFANIDYNPTGHQINRVAIPSACQQVNVCERDKRIDIHLVRRLSPDDIQWSQRSAVWEPCGRSRACDQEAEKII